MEIVEDFATEDKTLEIFSFCIILYHFVSFCIIFFHFLSFFFFFFFLSGAQNLIFFEPEFRHDFSFFFKKINFSDRLGGYTPFEASFLFFSSLSFSSSFFFCFSFLFFLNVFPYFLF